jgi:hypothetical protein
MKIPEFKITNEYGCQPLVQFLNLTDIEWDSVFQFEMHKVFAQFAGLVSSHETGYLLRAKVSERLQDMVHLGIIVENPFENHFYTVCALSLKEKQ